MDVQKSRSVHWHQYFRIGAISDRSYSVIPSISYITDINPMWGYPIIKNPTAPHTMPFLLLACINCANTFAFVARRKSPFTRKDGEGNHKDVQSYCEYLKFFRCEIELFIYTSPFSRLPTIPLKKTRKTKPRGYLQCGWGATRAAATFGERETPRQRRASNRHRKRLPGCLPWSGPNGGWKTPPGFRGKGRPRSPRLTQNHGHDGAEQKPVVGQEPLAVASSLLGASLLHHSAGGAARLRPLGSRPGGRRSARRRLTTRRLPERGASARPAWPGLGFAATGERLPHALRRRLLSLECAFGEGVCGGCRLLPAASAPARVCPALRQQLFLGLAGAKRGVAAEVRARPLPVSLSVAHLARLGWAASEARALLPRSEGTLEREPGGAAPRPRREGVWAPLGRSP